MSKDFRQRGEQPVEDVVLFRNMIVLIYLCFASLWVLIDLIAELLSDIQPCCLKNCHY